MKKGGGEVVDIVIFLKDGNHGWLVKGSNVGYAVYPCVALILSFYHFRPCPRPRTYIGLNEATRCRSFLLSDTLPSLRR